jgi:hypothetical protein
MNIVLPILGLPLAWLAIVAFAQAVEVAWAKPWNSAWPYIFSGLAFGMAYGVLVWLAFGGAG